MAKSEHVFEQDHVDMVLIVKDRKKIDNGFSIRMKANEHVLSPSIQPMDERWERFVQGVSDSHFFHQKAWLSLLEESYGFQPFVAVLSNSNGKFEAGIPLMEITSTLSGSHWISLPFTDHCIPLFSHLDQLQELLKYIADESNRNSNKQVQIRSGLSNNIRYSPDRSRVLHTMVLSSNPDEIYERFHKNQVKRNIQRALRANVTVRWANSNEDISTFYDLHLETRRRHGVPIQPKRFFELLWGRTSRDNHGLREFKSRWGAVEKDLTYSQFPTSLTNSGSR